MASTIPITKIDGLPSDLVRPHQSGYGKLLGIFDCGVLKMARGQSAFKQSDVTRALRAASAAGQPVHRFEIDRQGKMSCSSVSMGGKTRWATNGTKSNAASAEIRARLHRLAWQATLLLPPSRIQTARRWYRRLRGGGGDLPGGKAPWVALSVGTIARLAEDEEPERTRSERQHTALRLSHRMIGDTVSYFRLSGEQT
jgi:hypothetical protein